jgi:hypothetical protein
MKIEKAGELVMKAYAIICEYGAGSIHESIEMICKTEKIARSYYNDAEFYGRPVDIREIEIVTKPYQKPVKKKKVKKWSGLVSFPAKTIIACPETAKRLSILERISAYGVERTSELKKIFGVSICWFAEKRVDFVIEWTLLGGCPMRVKRNHSRRIGCIQMDMHPKWLEPKDCQNGRAAAERPLWAARKYRAKENSDFFHLACWHGRYRM